MKLLIKIFLLYLTLSVPYAIYSMELTKKDGFDSTKSLDDNLLDGMLHSSNDQEYIKFLNKKEEFLDSLLINGKDEQYWEIYQCPKDIISDYSKKYATCVLGQALQVRPGSLMVKELYDSVPEKDLKQRIEIRKEFLSTFKGQSLFYWDTYDCPKTFWQNPMEYTSCLIGKSVIDFRAKGLEFAEKWFGTSDVTDNDYSFGDQFLGDYHYSHELDPILKGGGISENEDISTAPLPAAKSVQKAVKKKMDDSKQLLEQKILPHFETMLDIFNEELDRSLGKFQQSLSMPTGKELSMSKMPGASFLDVKMIHHITDSIKMFGAVATVSGNYKLGSQLMVTGMGLREAAHGINTIVELSSTIASVGLEKSGGISAFLGPVGGMLMGACMLSKVFGLGKKKHKNKNGRNQMTQMMKAFEHAITRLSRQAEQYFTVTMQRFDNLESIFESHHITMLKNFFSLHHEIQDFHTALNRFIESADYCLNSVNHTHQLLLNNHVSISNNLQSLRVESLDKLLHRAELEIEKEEGTNNFSTILDKLYIEATTGAQSAYVTGAVVNPQDWSAITTAMATSAQTKHNYYTHPVFFNMNLIAKYVAAKTGTTFKQIANPIIWVRTTQRFMELIEREMQRNSFFPRTNTERDQLIEKLTTLLGHGKDILTCVNQVHENECISELLVEYQKSLVQLNHAITVFKNNYEASRQEEIQAELKKQYETQLLALRSNTLELTETIDRIKSAGTTFLTTSNQLTTAYLASFFNQIFTFQYDTNRNNWHAGTSEIVEMHHPEYLSMAWKNIKSHFEYKKKNIIEKIDQKFYALTKNEMPLSSMSICQVMYPADKNIYSLVLQLPDNLPFNSTFIMAHQYYNIGKISAEYEIKDGKFYINGYFNYGNHKKLILSMDIPYPQGMYSPNENLWHFWYGGRYAKCEDTLHIKPLPQTKKLQINPPVITESYTHYPPSTPYPAVQDIFVSTAHRNDIQGLALVEQEVNELIEQEKEQEQKAFNAKLIKETTPTNPLFILLEQLSGQHALLHALCALVYQEKYASNTALNQLCISETNVIKNGQDVRNFLEAYPMDQALIRSRSFIQKFLDDRQQNVMHIAQQISQIEPSKSDDFIKIMKRLTSLIECLRQREIKLQTVSQDKLFDRLVAYERELHEFKNLQESTNDKLKTMADQIALMITMMKNMCVTK